MSASVMNRSIKTIVALKTRFEMERAGTEVCLLGCINKPAGDVAEL